MCEACLAHQEANDVAFDQSIQSAALRIMDMELIEEQRILEMTANTPQAIQEATVGNMIGNIQESIDGLFTSIEDLNCSLEPIAQGEVPSSSIDEKKSEMAVKYIAELAYASERIQDATNRIIDMKRRLRL